MTKDIRIAITFPNHPKTIKLRRKIGHKGVDCLLKLWCFCGEYRPKGDMSNMSDEDVAIAAGWDEDPKVFIAALLEVGYIRARHATADNNARYYLHGWKDHNPWAYYSDERTEMARSAADARWEKRRKRSPGTTGTRPNRERGGCEAHTQRKRSGCEAYAEGNAPSPTPSPTPSPPPGGVGETHSVDDIHLRIKAILGQFKHDEKELVEMFLEQASAERKSGRIADRTRHGLLNELFQIRCDFPERFLAGMEETTDREKPNINYLRAVIAGLGKQKQCELRYRGNQKRREELRASRIARERADREHEKNLEDRKRRERARREEAGYGPDRDGATGGGVPRDGRGNRAEGNRGTGQNSRCPQVPAAQGGGRTMDDGQGCTPKVTEVSLSDYLPPESPGAVHADGGSSGDGDGGRGALVQASGTGSGGRS